jgi:hypothetical protein
MAIPLDFFEGLWKLKGVIASRIEAFLSIVNKRLILL